LENPEKAILKRRDTAWINERYMSDENDGCCDKCYKGICCSPNGYGLPMNIFKGLYWCLLLIGMVAAGTYLVYDYKK
jgi:hypothetical protein